MAQNYTKDKIIETALALFREKGYDCVSVSDICLACGITKTTFYYHLKSKDEILMYFYRSFTQTMVKQLYAMLTKDNYWEQIKMCYEMMTTTIQQIGPDLYSQLFIANLREDRGTYDLDPDLTEVMVLLIEKAQKSDQIRNQSPARQLYHASNMTLLGCDVRWSIKNGEFDHSAELFRCIESIFDVAPQYCSALPEETDVYYSTKMSSRLD